jgi:acetylornithine deacetylase
VTAAAELLSSLVAIDSVNPALVPGGAGEAEIAAFVAGRLAQGGLDARVDEVAPGRCNAIAVARGRGGGRSLLLNAHMDTVGVAGMSGPFTPRIEDGRLYGRGSYDMKAGLAAIMLAAERAANAGLRGDVIVAAVCDEEHASLGAEALARSVRADAAVVTEPTGLEVCVAHKGFVWLTVETAGVAAHGSRPDLGVDAITAMGPVLVALDRRAAELAQGERHPLLGHASLHATLIAGGQELSSYPERCRLDIERRTLPGERAEDVEAEVRACAPGATVATTFVRAPFEVAPGESVAAALRAAAAGVLGAEPGIVGHAAWMDAAVLSAAGIPTVVFGPGGEGAHAVEEWADIASVERCADVLTALIVDWCG